MPGGPQSLPPFLMTQKTMASLCPQWLQCEPLPATMAPFNPPPRATAPSLTACVRRALDTKGGVSRFSEHFTSIHQRRNKSNTTHTHPRPLTSGTAEAGLCQPHQNATFSWWRQGPRCVSRSLCKQGSRLFLPSTKDISIKMGFFCPLRRTKRKLGGVGGDHESKGRKSLPNKNQEGQQTDVNLYFRIFIRKLAHLFLCFQFFIRVDCYFY